MLPDTKLPAGTQVIFTRDDDPAKDWRHKKGVVAMVNNDSFWPRQDHVGLSLFNGYASLGHRTNLRLATPDDPGYHMTQEAWRKHNKLAPRRWFYFWVFVAVYLFITLLMVVL